MSNSFRRALNAGHIQVHGDLLNAISTEQADRLGVQELKQLCCSVSTGERGLSL